MRKNIKGFTLIEMLLVMVIISMIIYGSIAFYQQKALETRIDRTAAQMQQILNAALSYYIEKGTWPANLLCLQGSGAGCTTQYLPTSLASPWAGGAYYVASTKGVFYVFTQITTSSASTTARSEAATVAGSLPLSYTTSAAPVMGTVPAVAACAAGTSCTVVGSVNIPGDNLNNARAVNFSGLYRPGACVPVPECPVDKDGNTMTPQIFVAPVAVSGLNDPAPNQNNVYPISSFIAYATGGTSQSPGLCSETSQSSVVGTNANCTGQTMSGPTADRYWRVCLRVVTAKGQLTTSSQWAASETLMAITRCAVSNESSGSAFSVYQ